MGALQKEHNTKRIIQFYGLSIFEISEWYQFQVRQQVEFQMIFYWDMHS